MFVCLYSGSLIHNIDWSHLPIADPLGLYYWYMERVAYVDSMTGWYRLHLSTIFDC